VFTTDSEIDDFLHAVREIAKHYREMR